MPQAARRAPDTTQAREALHRALRHVDDHDNPHALAHARAAAQEAVDAMPYPWLGRNCAEYRRTANEETCRSRTRTRCAAFRAGDPMPPADY
ncbi:hypothetical protein OHB33_00075 [Streptomyces sp. NBC_01558]|uniref:hypothetical protein n=1 Tax=Streptomyces sp. NBC_01558 TaxID=2975878 RepID=UPI002DDB3B6A|nr:hypothetical protein [Streptomyces sp. NBC_01558]WSD74832.1 hypothetical protein OHB33_00075 [Streptomyces sp. NBC_01558]